MLGRKPVVVAIQFREEAEVQREHQVEIVGSGAAGRRRLLHCY
jgi:hypothetical protein